MVGAEIRRACSRSQSAEALPRCHMSKELSSTECQDIPARGLMPLIVGSELHEWQSLYGRQTFLFQSLRLILR
jgi:hypothetical protein